MLLEKNIQIDPKFTIHLTEQKNVRLEKKIVYDVILPIFSI